ncbi:MAG: Rpn family recombination-promoting nuclease/putative transposase [Armatimonadetes bacterium]|nr:Rpn family recombination-promoting nuclease/putative transposase [Armatimonadota bacterium]
MKSATLFYYLFQEFPSIFFELIGCEGRLAEDYTFTSVEVKQPDFRIDGVFVPRLSDPEHPVYFVEVQFQKDPRLHARLYAEIFLYLYQQEAESDWRGIVIFPYRRMETAVPIGYRQPVEAGYIQYLYLDALAKREPLSPGVGVLGLVIEPEGSAGEKARRLIARARNDIRDEPLAEGLVELIEQIMVYKFPMKSREEVKKMLGLADLKKTRVYQEAHEEGLQQGLERAIEMGLTIKFGTDGLRLLPEIRKIRDTDVLEAIVAGLKTARTLEELQSISKN